MPRLWGRQSSRLRVVWPVLRGVRNCFISLAAGRAPRFGAHHYAGGFALSTGSSRPIGARRTSRCSTGSAWTTNSAP